MSGSTALAKIRVRVKQLKKKHPGAKHSTLQKQAGAEYRAGKLKARKPRKASKPRKKKRAKVSGKRKYSVTHRVKKVGTVKRHRKRAAPKKKPAVRTLTRTRTVTKYRRVGTTGMNTTTTLLLVGGLALGAYLLLKKPTPTYPVQLVQTGNTARDSSAANILAYAQAANLGISAITALIHQLNDMSDSAVVSAAASPDLTINTLLALPQGGPGISL